MKPYKDQFVENTLNHIKLVNKYASKIGCSYPLHDQDKLHGMLFNGYYLIVKDVLTPEEERLLDTVTYYHIKSNKHHPEYWSITPLRGFTRKNPCPLGIVEATRMPEFAINEMLCDWCAMSEIYNNTPYEWFEKVNGIRWYFVPKQQQYILDTLKKLWND